MIKFGARSAQGTNQFRRMVEDMPINVLTCNLKDFTIDYANKSSIETLKQLEHVLPCKADDLVGQCIDIFHKDPSHQRRLLADPRNLPHKATIEIGGEYLDLLISAIRDDQGNYVAPMLTWAVVTEKVKADAESAQLMQMLDTMPMNVMLLDPKDFTITYVNQTSKDTLKPLQSLLPCPIDDLVGQCVDIFHSNPAHQRGILGNPKNLPHTAHIQLGDETLSLQVSAVYDKDGNYASTMLTWAVVTEKVKADAEKVKADAKSAQLMQMLDTMPVNVMLLEPENFTITYVNQTSKDTLKPLQSLLPCPIDDLVGQCVDIFHKNPAHQRGILRNPKNLPHTAKIKLGDETLSLRVSAVNDKDNNYAAAMLTWEVVTRQVEMAENVGEIVESVSSASTEMRSTAESMAATAEETNNQASTVAAASEQLASSIVEISRQVTQSAEIASKAMVDAQETNDKIRSLDIAAQKIGAVVSIITDIADQTNLLALNATIEAARAGDAGKGFAVVASEVKNLANQTGKATEEISAQVEDIQAATKDSVNAIKGISETIGQVDEITTAIAAAVEEQGAATQEVTSNISGVTAASSETGAAANQVLSASDELASQSNNLKEEIAKFIGD